MAPGGCVVSLVGFLVFLAVFLLLTGLSERSRRDRLKEEIARSARAPLGSRFAGRARLSALWRVSDFTPLSYEKAFLLGLVSAVVAFFVAFSMAPGVSVNLMAAGTVIGAIAFVAVPRIHNQALLQKRIKGFQAEIEFGVHTLVDTVNSTGGNLIAGVEEVARVGQGAVGSEFRLMAQDIMGSKKKATDAFRTLAMRVPCQEALDLADAAELYETVGGGAAVALFDNVAAAIKDSLYVRSKAHKAFRSLKRGATIIMGMSVLLTVLMLTQTDWSGLLFSTSQGRAILEFAALIDLVAFLGIQMVLKSIDLS